jgi:hypothetical protein
MCKRFPLETRQMMEKGQRFTVASLLAVVLLWLLSLPLIQFTWTVVENWVRFHLHKGQLFSIEHWLDATTLALALAGPIVLLLSAFGVLATIRQGWPRWPVLAVPLGFVVALYAMVCIPNVLLWDSELSGNLNHLRSLEHRLEGWARIHERFPLTRAEVDSAVGEVATEPGPYWQRGKRLDYQIEVVLNQSAPYRPSPQQPGIVYFAVNSTGWQFWLTVSGINAPFSDRVTMARTDAFTASKQPWEGLLVFSEANVHYQKNGPR